MLKTSLNQIQKGENQTTELKTTFQKEVIEWGCI